MGRRFDCVGDRCSGRDKGAAGAADRSGVDRAGGRYGWICSGDPRGCAAPSRAAGATGSERGLSSGGATPSERAARRDPRGWRCVRVSDHDGASALRAARWGWPGRVLLVVDYAETRIRLPQLLREVAADAGPVRLLLLARSAGEWWDRLSAGEPAVRDLLAVAGGNEPLPTAV